MARRRIAQKHLVKLGVIAKATGKTRKQLLKTVSPEFMRVLSDGIFDILSRKIPVNASQKRKLHKYKTLLRKLADKKGNSLTARKRVLQKGGQFMSLIAPLLTAGIPWVVKGIKKLIKRRKKR